MGRVEFRFQAWHSQHEYKRVHSHAYRVEAQEAVLNEDTDQHPEMDQRSAELYDILCQHCAGDALRIVRGVADMHGIETWRKLFK